MLSWKKLHIFWRKECKYYYYYYYYFQLLAVKISTRRDVKNVNISPNKKEFKPNFFNIFKSIRRKKTVIEKCDVVATVGFNTKPTKAKNTGSTNKYSSEES